MKGTRKKKSSRLVILENISDNLHNINETLGKQLEKQNEIIQQILDIMPRPASKFIRILETIVLLIGVLGLISIADIIFNWIIGGE